VKTVNPSAMMILEHFCDNEEEKKLANDGMYLWRNMNYAYANRLWDFPDNSDFSGLYGHFNAYGLFGWVHGKPRRGTHEF
jgi:hypothetical protein